MQLIPLLIGSLMVVGIGCFCLDLYRNRHRLLTRPNPQVDLMASDTSTASDGHDNLQAADSIASYGSHHVGHATSEASHCASHSVGHCVDASSHSVSHH
ncbi:MAG: hypothetical protein SFY66_20100 [Oculatellaceae cyanobacterium bins.114]|nr:hypothetical protein [Oculatellaceae cyanobacterium bins.114]